MQIFIKKLHSNAILPIQAHLGDAGFDLCCLEDFILSPQSTKLISTGLQLASCPTDFNHNPVFLHIVSRSGLAVKDHIITLAGIVDSSYTGEIKVVLHNLDTDKAKSFKAGDRIAQLVIQQIVTNTKDNHFISFCETDFVQDTTRASDGFGSTD